MWMVLLVRLKVHVLVCLMVVACAGAVCVFERFCVQTTTHIPEQAQTTNRECRPYRTKDRWTPSDLCVAEQSIHKNTP